jgi:hypothetical protein
MIIRRSPDVRGHRAMSFLRVAATLRRVLE